jgi:hypothetical protein
MTAHRKYQGPWRVNRTETKDYPGLFVHDSISSGSIRLEGAAAIWAITADVFEFDWEFLGRNWGKPKMTEDEFRSFLHCLMQQRGEFGRLVLVLADVERRSTWNRAWWETKSQRNRMIKQLQRCIDALVEEEGAAS